MALLSDLGAAVLAAVNLMKIEFTVFGVTLTYWNLMLYLMAGGIIVYLIVRFLHD